MKRVVFSIASYKKLAQARVLLDSVKVQHNDIKTFLVIAERRSQTLQNYGHDILDLEQLQVPMRLAFQYDSEEFQEALKPWALEYFLKDYESVVYFDPEVEIFSSLTDIFSWVQDYEAVVAPAVTAPLPYDGLLPDNGTVLRAGLFHSGFFAARSSYSLRVFIQYWKEEVVCGLAGADFEEKWMQGQLIFSGITSFVDSVKIVHLDSFHFSIWNASQRELSYTGNTFVTSHGPLVSMHFQGQEDLQDFFLPRGAFVRPFKSGGAMSRILRLHQEKVVRVEKMLQPYSTQYSFGFYANGGYVCRKDRRVFFHMSSFEKRNIKDPFQAPDEMRKRVMTLSMPRIFSSYHELQAIKRGPSWRIGRLMTCPIRVGKNILLRLFPGMWRAKKPSRGELC